MFLAQGSKTAAIFDAKAIRQGTISQIEPRNFAKPSFFSRFRTRHFARACKLRFSLMPFSQKPNPGEATQVKTLWVVLTRSTF
jgi:hypothetical protein